MNEEFQWALQYVRSGTDLGLIRQAGKKVGNTSSAIDVLVDDDFLSKAAEADAAAGSYECNLQKAGDYLKGLQKLFGKMTSGEKGLAAEWMSGGIPQFVGRHLAEYAEPLAYVAVVSAQLLVQHASLSRKSEEVLRAYLKQ